MPLRLVVSNEIQILSISVSTLFQTDKWSISCKKIYIKLL